VPWQWLGQQLLVPQYIHWQQYKHTAAVVPVGAVPVVVPAVVVALVPVVAVVHKQHDQEEKLPNCDDIRDK